MFKLFKKKSPTAKLESQYDKLLKEAFELSRTNRTASDEKTAEANAILEKINRLKESQT